MPTTDWNYHIGEKGLDFLFPFPLSHKPLRSHSSRPRICLSPTETTGSSGILSAFISFSISASQDPRLRKFQSYLVCGIIISITHTHDFLFLSQFSTVNQNLVPFLILWVQLISILLGKNKDRNHFKSGRQCHLKSQNRPPIYCFSQESKRTRTFPF